MSANKKIAGKLSGPTVHPLSAGDWFQSRSFETRIERVQSISKFKLGFRTARFPLINRLY